MGMMQRRKGATGEREIVKLLNDYGFWARRGQVFNGEPDIICPALPVHFEVKRHEELCLPQWFRQAAKDCGENYPAVVYRQSRKPWTIIMNAGDFTDLTAGEKITEQPFKVSMLFEEFLAIMKELAQ